jgi:hypothetical protein
MIIQPKLNFRQVGLGYNPPTLDSTRHYEAVHATNQPDWEKRGKVFIEFPDAPGNSILLDSADYTIIEP